MFAVSIFYVDSDGSPGNSIRLYKTYEESKKIYDEFIPKLQEDEQYGRVITKKFKNKEQMHQFRREPNFDRQEQYIVYITYACDKYECYRAYKDGSWKRPCGIELTYIDTNADIIDIDVLTYPLNRTYE